MKYATTPVLHFVDDNGKPLTNGFLWVYLADSDTPVIVKNEYGTNLPNPVMLDSRGECAIILDSGILYKFKLCRADGSVVWEHNHILYGDGEIVQQEGEVEVLAGDGNIIVELSTEQRGAILVKKFTLSLSASFTRDIDDLEHRIEAVDSDLIQFKDLTQYNFQQVDTNIYYEERRATDRENEIEKKIPLPNVYHNSTPIITEDIKGSFRVYNTSSPYKNAPDKMVIAYTDDNGQEQERFVGYVIDTLGTEGQVLSLTQSYDGLDFSWVDNGGGGGGDGKVKIDANGTAGYLSEKLYADPNSDIKINKVGDRLQIDVETADTNDPKLSVSTIDRVDAFSTAYGGGNETEWGTYDNCQIYSFRRLVDSKGQVTKANFIVGFNQSYSKIRIGIFDGNTLLGATKYESVYTNNGQPAPLTLDMYEEYSGALYLERNKYYRVEIVGYGCSLAGENHTNGLYQFDTDLGFNLQAVQGQIGWRTDNFWQTDFIPFIQFSATEL